MGVMEFFLGRDSERSVAGAVRGAPPAAVAAWSAMLFSVGLAGLSFLGRVDGGERVPMPYGPHLYLAMSVAAGIHLMYLARQGRVVLPPWPATLAAAALFVGAMVSAAAGRGPMEGVRLSLVLALIAWPALMLGSAGGAAVRVWAWLLLAWALVAGLGAWGLELAGPVRVAGVELVNHHHGLDRWSFLFLEANDLGGLTAAGFTAAVYLSWAWAGGSRLARAVAAVSIPVLLFVFWKTNSRGALLWVLWSGLVLGAGMLYALFVRMGRPRGYWPVVAVLLVGAGTAAVAVWAEEFGRFLRLHQADLTSGRWRVWQIYWEQWWQHPWLGIGFGTSEDFLRSVKVYPYSPLNAFIGMLGETGLAGLLPLVVLWVGGLARALTTAVRMREVDGQKAAAALWLVAMLGGLALQQMGEWTVLRVHYQHALFFLLAGSAWTAGSLRRE